MSEANDSDRQAASDSVTLVARQFSGARGALKLAWSAGWPVRRGSRVPQARPAGSVLGRPSLLRRSSVASSGRSEQAADHAPTCWSQSPERSLSVRPPQPCHPAPAGCCSTWSRCARYLVTYPPSDWYLLEATDPTSPTHPVTGSRPKCPGAAGSGRATCIIRASGCFSDLRTSSYKSLHDLVTPFRAAGSVK